MTNALVVGLAAVVALLGVLVVGVLRSHAEILRALHDLGVNLDPTDAGGVRTVPPRRAVPAAGTATGTAATDITGVDPGGTAIQLAVANTRHRTLLAFLSSSCLTCQTFWSTLDDPTIDIPLGARLIVVTQGAEAESPSAVAELAAPHVQVVLSSEAWAAYGVPGAPYFMLIDGREGRVVGEGTATSWSHVSTLLRRALADAELDGTERAALIDGELRAAGIEPGDPSLHPGAME